MQPSRIAAAQPVRVPPMMLGSAWSCVEPVKRSVHWSQFTVSSSRDYSYETGSFAWSGKQNKGRLRNRTQSSPRHLQTLPSSQIPTSHLLYLYTCRRSSSRLPFNQPQPLHLAPSGATGGSTRLQWLCFQRSPCSDCWSVSVAWSEYLPPEPSIVPPNHYHSFPCFHGFPFRLSGRLRSMVSRSSSIQNAIAACVAGGMCPKSTMSAFNASSNRSVGLLSTLHLSLRHHESAPLRRAGSRDRGPGRAIFGGHVD